MQAIVMHETGGPEVLRMEEVDPPRPGEGEVLVRVRAASVNPIDWKFRRGPDPEDSAGDPRHRRLRSRRRSLAPRASPRAIPSSASPRAAPMPRWRSRPPALIAARPAGVSDEQAAALPVAGTTAWQALFDRGALKEGQTVVIAGASGGVGHIAVQLASSAGARTVGIGSARNREFVLGLGATDYVDYTSEDVGDGSATSTSRSTRSAARRARNSCSTVRPGGGLCRSSGVRRPRSRPPHAACTSSCWCRSPIPRSWPSWPSASPQASSVSRSRDAAARRHRSRTRAQRVRATRGGRSSS